VDFAIASIGAIALLLEDAMQIGRKDEVLFNPRTWASRSKTS